MPESTVLIASCLSFRGPRLSYRISGAMWCRQAIVKMIDISRASKQEKDDALKESKAC